MIIETGAVGQASLDNLTEKTNALLQRPHLHKGQCVMLTECVSSEYDYGDSLRVDSHEDDENNIFIAS